MYNNTQFAEFSSNSVKVPGTQTTAKAPHRATPGKAHHAAWGAFQAGMQFLQKYAGRSPGNSENIAISNLKLLHRSLLKDPGYAQSLKRASSTPKNCLPSSQCIFDDKGLRADLLTLKPGTTIQLASQQNSCAMYLSITGKPSMHSPDNTPLLSKYWWNRYRWLRHGQPLKNGEAMFISSQKQIKKLLSAKKNECVLLRIQLLNG